MTYEQLVVRVLVKVSGVTPEDKAWAANWVLNSCEESQLLKIAELTKIYQRYPAEKLRELFIKRILNPEYLMREGAD